MSINIYRLIWLCICLAVYLYKLPSIEILNDDAEHGQLAILIALGVKFPLISSGWFVIPHGALSSYILAPFYLIRNNLIDLYAGVITFLLLTHYLLIRIGDSIGDKKTGWFASLLFLISPIIFHFYGLKIWNCYAVTFFSTLLTYSIVRYGVTKSSKHYCLAFFALGSLIEVHIFTAFLALPVALTLLSIQSRCKSYLGILVFLILVSPHIGYFVQQGHLWIIAIIGGICCFYLLLSHYQSIFEDYVPLVMRILAVSVSSSYFIFYSFLSESTKIAYQQLAGYLSEFSIFTAERVGDVESSRVFSKLQILSPTVNIFFLGCMYAAVFWNRFNLTQKLILSYGISSFVTLCIFYNVLKGPLPYQYFLSIYPVLLIIVSIFVFRTKGILSSVMIASIALLCLYSVINLQKFVLTSGGQSWHHASYNIKEAVIANIINIDPDANIYFATRPAFAGFAGYDIGGWQLISDQIRKTTKSSKASPPGNWYLYEPNALMPDKEMWQTLEGSADVKARYTFSSVLIYYSDVFLPLDAPLIHNIVRR